MAGWITRQHCTECKRNMPCFCSYDNRKGRPPEEAPCPYKKDMIARWKE